MFKKYIHINTVARMFILILIYSITIKDILLLCPHLIIPVLSLVILKINYFINNLFLIIFLQISFVLNHYLNFLFTYLIFL